MEIFTCIDILNHILSNLRIPSKISLLCTNKDLHACWKYIFIDTSVDLSLIIGSSFYDRYRNIIINDNISSEIKLPAYATHVSIQSSGHEIELPQTVISIESGYFFDVLFPMNLRSINIHEGLYNGFKFINPTTLTKLSIWSDYATSKWKKIYNQFVNLTELSILLISTKYIPLSVVELRFRPATDDPKTYKFNHLTNLRVLSITYDAFRGGFTNAIHYSIPKFIHTLSVHEFFDCKPLNIKSNIKHLTWIGDGCPSPYIHRNLESLMIDTSDFICVNTTRLQLHKLKKLKSLDISDTMFHYMYGGKFPPNLTNLSIQSDSENNLTNVIPKTIKYLLIDGKLGSKTIIPPTVKTLELLSNRSINIKLLPKTLDKLILPVSLYRRYHKRLDRLNIEIIVT